MIKRDYKKLLYILELAVFILIIIAIPIYLVAFHKDFLLQFKSLHDVMDFLKGYKGWGILVYIVIQVLQIIISIIPGQAFQFAAGYLYGFLGGLGLSIIGAAIGTTITYYLAKILGRDAIIHLFGKDKMGTLLKRLNTKRAYLIIFLIYLFPGLPKDIVGYAAGLSNVNFKVFLLISTVGRSFGMSGSLIFGVLYLRKLYVPMAILAIITVVLVITAFIFRKRLSNWCDRLFEKLI